MTGMPFAFASASDDGNALRRVEHVEQAREVDAAEEQADGRHDDALDERRDDLPNAAPMIDADGEIDDVAARDEVAEFFQHGRAPVMASLSGGGRLPEISGVGSDPGD